MTPEERANELVWGQLDREMYEHGLDLFEKMIAEQIRAAIAEEAESIAVLIEQAHVHDWCTDVNMLDIIAKAIRARSG